MRAIDVRLQVVEPEAVDRGVGGGRIEVRRRRGCETLLHGVSSGGVTFFQVLPPSRVTWIRPSSVPAQIVLTSLCDGATA